MNSERSRHERSECKPERAQPLRKYDLLGGVHHEASAEFYFEFVHFLTVSDIDYRSLFVAKHFRQKAAPPYVITNFHFDLFSIVVHIVVHNDQPHSICSS
jgi:hypothetical protein